MKNSLISKILFTFFVIFFFFLFTTSTVLAQDDLKLNAFNEIVDALNKETTQIFDDYTLILDEIQKGDESGLVKFSNRLPVWKSVLNETENIFNKYKFSNDTQISEISNLALEANNEALIGINFYVKAINSESDAEFDNYIEDADKYFIESSEKHSRAVDLYNNYSGYSSSVLIRNLLIFFSILLAVLSFILLIKSRRKSQLEAEKIRAEVYKNLFSNSLWMTGGLAITTIGYLYATKEGGTYYILYGPILIGGWKLLKGFYYYLTEGRKVLNQLNLMQKNEAIKESYSLPKKEEKTEKVCQFCGSKNLEKNVICKNCGENLL